MVGIVFKIHFDFYFIVIVNVVFGLNTVFLGIKLNSSIN